MTQHSTAGGNTETSQHTSTAGPLAGLKVVEFTGLGPGPHAAMILADLGADVVRIDRPGNAKKSDVTARGRRIVEADLKDPAAIEGVLELLDRADVLIEGFRPGVMERLGLGPDVLLERNPGLVYGRMTGWGQDGPLADRAGHDMGYIARTGMASLIGSADNAPVPPLNLVGDFGGGSMFLVTGILAALFERSSTGRGQVIDAAIVDGTATLATMLWALKDTGMWQDARGRNFLDGSQPSYSYYRTSDGEYLAVAPLEPQFFEELREHLGLPEWTQKGRFDPRKFAEVHQLIADAIAQHPLAHWTEIFDPTDACVAPVWSMEQALDDPQLKARGTYTEVDGVTQPRPAPRFSAHGRLDPRPVSKEAQPIDTVVRGWSVD